MDRNRVYILHHSRGLLDGVDDVKLIGVYSTELLAKSAIERLSKAPGFSEHVEGFEVSSYEVDVTFWTDGFVAGDG